MSCNGCRILRKGCNENCILRRSLQAIDTPQAQANATLFVAKFFGRAGLISFLSSVPQSQTPALFQSLLLEACGRTVNPVSGAVGLLSAGKWQACESAVETVLQGGIPRPLPEFDGGVEGNNDDLYGSQCLNKRLKRKGIDSDETRGHGVGFPARMTSRGRMNRRRERSRPASPSDDSETTTECGFVCHDHHNHHENDTKLLRLFF